MTEDIDARGMRCPLPVLKLRKAMAERAAGARLRLVADDPAARVDVPHFCAEAGHRLIAAEESEGQLTFVVERGAG